jgi:biopolymer transport protein ExbB/TolQ/ABC-type transporter Mla subunit MlaD
MKEVRDGEEVLQEVIEENIRQQTSQANIFSSDSEIYRQYLERKKRPFIEQLASKFANACKNLERVDSYSLLQEVWNNKVELYSWNSDRWERVDRFCQAVPNLLLALGLLGTFIGLTVVLSSISPSNLTEKLEVAINGMSTAFISSLSAILCSICLIVFFNWFRNTTLAKEQLFASIEDYLNRIYLPMLPQRERYSYSQVTSPLGQISSQINYLVRNLFGQFITNLSTSVGNAVESSLGRRVEELSTLHINFLNETGDSVKGLIGQANKTYSAFSESTTLLSAAATRLQGAVDSSASTLETSLSTYQESISNSSLTLSQNIDNLRETSKVLEANTSQFQQMTQHTFSYFESITERLEVLTQNAARTSDLALNLQGTIAEVSRLVHTLEQFNQSSIQVTSVLSDVGGTINSAGSQLQRFSIKAEGLLDSTLESQQKLEEITSAVRQGSDIFQASIESFRILQDNSQNLIAANQVSWNEVFKELQDNESAFNQAAEDLRNLCQQVSSQLEGSSSLFNSLNLSSDNLVSATESFIHKFSDAVSRLNSCGDQLVGIKEELKTLVFDVRRQINILEKMNTNS